MIIARFHRSSGEILLAACDSELIGKCFETEDIKLDLGIEFYNGEEVTEDEFCGMLAQATSANLVGPRVIELAVKENMVHPDAVIEICGVPHAMFFSM